MKGGFNVRLGERTLLLGPSGSGKSAVLDAIWFASHGALPHVQGRAEVRQEQRLLWATGGEPPAVSIAFTPADTTGVAHIYETAQSFMLKEPRAACLAFAGAPPLPRLAPQEATRDLDACRAVLGRWWSAYGKEPDPEFLRWYVRERENVENEAVTRSRQGRATAKRAHRNAVKKVWEGVQRARHWVPERLGELTLDFGSPDAPHFTLGLLRSGVPHYALSGAEWVIALSALALGCLCPTPDDAVAFLAPADVSMDLVLLEEWMQMLDDAPAQVVLTSTYADAFHRVGWSTITFDAAR